MVKLDQVNYFIFTTSTLIGKSTQVPQFLYERGYSNPEGPNPGKIGVNKKIYIHLIYFRLHNQEE